MGAMASQISSATIVYSAVYSGGDQRKHQISASLAFVWGIPAQIDSNTGNVSFDDVIMVLPPNIAIREAAKYGASDRS